MNVKKKKKCNVLENSCWGEQFSKHNHILYSTSMGQIRFTIVPIDQPQQGINSYDE